jgi:hypothetical protein
MYLLALNWAVIIIVGVAVLALLFFVMRRNREDKKDLEETITRSDVKPPEHDTDSD